MPGATTTTAPSWAADSPLRSPARAAPRRTTRCSSTPATWATATTAGRSRSAPCRRARSRSRSGSRSRPASRSMRSSPRTRSSASASVRVNSSTSAVTIAPRSRVRRSACSSGMPCDDQGAEVLLAGRGHRHVGPGLDLDAAPRPAGRLDRPGQAGRRVTGTGQRPQPLVVHAHAAAEHLAEHVGDPGRAAAVQQHVGEPVVGLRGPLDGLRAGPQQPARPVRADHGLARGVEQAGVLQRHRGVRGERGQQGDLTGRERPYRAVHREQRADHVALHHQRDAEDGPDLLAVDRGVDEVAVHEPVVALVVLGEVRRPGLGDQPEQAGAERQPQLAELRGERAVGDLHVRRAVGLVVERQVGHVRVQQLPGPAHDRGQDGVEVADRGEVVGGVVEGGQLGLAAPVPGHPLAHLQGQRVLVGGVVAEALEQLVVRLPRGVGVQEVEEGPVHQAVILSPAAPGQVPCAHGSDPQA